MRREARLRAPPGWCGVGGEDGRLCARRPCPPFHIQAFSPSASRAASAGISGRPRWRRAGGWWQARGWGRPLRRRCHPLQHPPPAPVSADAGALQEVGQVQGRQAFRRPPWAGSESRKSENEGVFDKPIRQYHYLRACLVCALSFGPPPAWAAPPTPPRPIPTPTSTKLIPPIPPAGTTSPIPEPPSPSQLNSPPLETNGAARRQREV